MASSREIKAGGAFVEVTTRDKTGAGLARAQARLAIFARSVKTMSTALAGGLRAIGHGLTFVGSAVAGFGAGILAALGQSVKTFMDVSEHARKMGKVIAGIDPKKAERLSKAVSTLQAVWGAIQFRVGEALAEPLMNALLVLIKLGAQVANFVQNNQGLVMTIAAVGAVALVAGVAIVALGGAFILAASAVAGVAAILSALATPVGLVVGLAAVLAAVVLLAAGAFLVLAESGTGVVSGILAALANGSILRAWQIITQGMEVMWKAMAFAIENVFFNMIGRVIKAMDEAFIKSGFLEGLIGGAAGPSAASIAAAAAGSASSAAQTGAKGIPTAAAFDMAAAIADLAKITAGERSAFMSRFASVGFSLPDLGKLVNSGNRQGFGVTGSTNAATAGQNRSLNGIQAEQKKTNEYLDRIIEVLKKMGVTGTLEFTS